MGTGPTIRHGADAHTRARHVCAALVIAACGEEAINPVDFPDPPLPMCDGEGDPGGAWNEMVLDWNDVGPPEDDPEAKPGECAHEILPHHPSLSPVHAVHMPTPSGGELLLYHGENEERVWPIGGEEETMRWHPIPQCVPINTLTNCVLDGGPVGACEVNGWACDEDSDCPPATSYGYPNIFCGGQTLLATGDVFVAGGNVTGGGDGGGLYEAFLFDPRTADEDVLPYGWSRVGDPAGAPEDMEVDRWYPTLTGLPDGRVLISGGASLVPGGQNTFEVFDPSAPPGQQIEKLPGWLDFHVVAGAHMPTYPFMFVLPNGDIFYAGGEGASAAAFDGRVLVPSYGGALTDWHWADYVANSSIAGGSAVMYRPGKIMKSGGVGGQDDEVANNTTEVIDLSGVPSDTYDNAPGFFTQRNEIPGAMHQPRHFHTLTLLADGRVLATGGNMRGNDERGDVVDIPCEYGGTQTLDIPCDEGCPSFCGVHQPSQTLRCSLYGRIKCGAENPCPGGAVCGSDTYCVKTCTTDADCPPIGDEPEVCWEEAECPASEDTQVCAPFPSFHCYPGDSACFATKEAEIWDPECESWAIYDAQDHERMYHSVALLIPDGRVLSAGGGHERGGLVDQANAEYFEPIYGDGFGQRPEVVVVDDDIPNDEDYTVHIPYAPAAVTVELLNEAAQDVERVTLVRLGSVTHQFDMGQLFVELPFDHQPDGELMTVAGPEPLAGNPFASAVAPPGYYMMFVWGDETPSIGQYVHVGGPEAAAMWSAPIGKYMEVVERSCLTEPIEGVCPWWAVEETLVAFPKADGPAGSFEGWNVVVPAGLVRDPEAPSDVELETVKARAIEACRAQWRNQPGIEANCEAAGAFDTPVLFLKSSQPALDLVLPDRQDGSGVFDGELLKTCQLGLDCCSEFDESICSSAPLRTTPAETPLGVGEEYRVALDPAISKVTIVTNVGTYSSKLTGSIGYSFCAAADGDEPCPFYLGSFEAKASSSITATMRCADGTTSSHTIENLVTRLGQPAFGIAAVDSSEVGFPTGALVVETAVDVGGSHYSRRRPNEVDVVMNADGGRFDANGLTTTLTLPCNDSLGTVKVHYAVAEAGKNQPLDAPPSVTIDIPSVVSCGKETPLAATATDPDDDVDTVRWYVDDVLLAPFVSTLTFTRAHTLRVEVRDQRGAATSSTKVVGCH